MKLKVLTPEGLAFEKEVKAVRAPGSEGYLGVLRGHAPLITTLKQGTLSWTTVDDLREQIEVGEGLLEVAYNNITLRVAEAVAS